jgi:hypothetical protein
MKLAHAILLLLLACLFGYGISGYFPEVGRIGGLMCAVAAGFRSLQIISDEIGEVAYAEFVGDPIE